MDLSAKYRIGVWGIVILVLLNLGLISLIWFGPPGKGPRMGPRVENPDPNEFFVKELGLNEDQAKALVELRDQHKVESEEIRFQIHDLSQQIVDELFSKSPDTIMVRELSDSIGARQAEFERSVYAHFGQIKQLCNPGQQERLKRLILETLKRAKLPPPPGRGPGNSPDRPGDRPPPPGGHPPPPPGGTR